MMNRKNMTASTLDETALDAYYTLTESGTNYGIGLALAATLNSLKNRNTSSPVRILRDKESYQHITLKGLFPCGEGAGYAGGIVSAAIDGERCAEGVAGYLSLV